VPLQAISNAALGPERIAVAFLVTTSDDTANTAERDAALERRFSSRG